MIFNEDGQIWMMMDPQTGVVWEEYAYTETRDMRWVRLFDPAVGKKIRLEYLPKQSILKIYWEDGTDSIGFVFLKDMASLHNPMDLLNIQISEGNRYAGVGTTIVRWLALKAAREGRILQISNIINFQAAYLFSQLYQYNDQFTLTTFDPASNVDTDIPEAKDQVSVAKILLEHSMYIILPDQTEKDIRVTNGVIDISNLPPGYTATLENGKLKVLAPPLAGEDVGHEVTLNYRDPIFNFFGQPDVTGIAQAQKQDYADMIVTEFDRQMDP